MSTFKELVEKMVEHDADVVISNEVAVWYAQQVKNAGDDMAILTALSVLSVAVRMMEVRESLQETGVALQNMDAALKAGVTMPEGAV